MCTTSFLLCLLHLIVSLLCYLPAISQLCSAKGQLGFEGLQREGGFVQVCVSTQCPAGCQALYCTCAVSRSPGGQHPQSRHSEAHRDQGQVGSSPSGHALASSYVVARGCASLQGSPYCCSRRWCCHRQSRQPASGASTQGCPGPGQGMLHCARLEAWVHYKHGTQSTLCAGFGYQAHF